LKRGNYSPHTVKNYMNILRHFVLWVYVPIEEVDHYMITEYIDYLLGKRLKPKTINCHIACIRMFYRYLHYEEGMDIANPVKKGNALRLPKPLPRHLNDDEVRKLLDVVSKPRDRALIMVMLRCGLRVEEVVDLTFADLDLKRNKILVRNGKGGKGRVVYISTDARMALIAYLKVRHPSRSKGIFLVEKGIHTGKPISVRGVQKRIEYYAGKARIKVSCHQLRHTMATQMLNAEAEVVTIQDLLGHNWITTTERYCTVSNIKVMKDYFKAMTVIMERSTQDPHIDGFA
jgi:site-specific recombinase XerD